jgi:ATP-binding cassette subfamily C protein LapB
MLIRKPSVLFLDEPSSALDTASEANLVQELAAWLGKEVTLIVSTHKGQFLRLVDRIVVLDGGRIVADGPREEILNKMKAGLKARRATPEEAQPSREAT